MNQSMLVNKADSTVNLNSTAEEMEVLDLDQDLMEEEPEQMEEDTATPHTQAQAKDKEGKTSPSEIKIRSTQNPILERERRVQQIKYN